MKIIYFAVVFLALVFLSAPPVYAGPICEGLLECVPFFTAILVFTYPWVSIGIVLIFIAFLRSFKGKDKKSALYLLIAGLVFSMIQVPAIYINQHRMDKEYKEIAQKADFDTYIPQYKPGGFSLRALGIGNPKEADNPYLTGIYQNEEGAEFRIHEYGLAKNVKNSSGECGPPNPEYDFYNKIAIGCKSLATTPEGYKIYLDCVDYCKGVEAYVTIGNTRISINHAYEDALSREELIKFVDSLEKTPADKIPFVERE